MKRVAAALILIAGGSAAAAAGLANPPGLRPDRVVLLMRHGVRPPTKSPPMANGIAAKTWPSWGVSPGYLTERGAAAIRLIAGWDRASWTRSGILGAGCPRIAVIADSDQRTIATGDAYAAGFAPGCAATIEHKPQDEADPMFSPIEEKVALLDEARAKAAVLAAAGPAGIAGEEKRVKPLLARLDAILCGREAAQCGVSGEPTRLVDPAPNKRPKLAGSLDTASTAAQILLLEYADNKPMSEVGWGRATRADIERLAEFHALEFRLLARPAYVARANLSLIAPRIAGALFDRTPAAADVTMISGHDTNIANLGGLLDLHWKVGAMAPDDPLPGGAIVLERLSDARGTAYVRASYRAQTLAQIRGLAKLGGKVRPYQRFAPIRGCKALGIAGLCTRAQFQKVMGA